MPSNWNSILDVYRSRHFQVFTRTDLRDIPQNILMGNAFLSRPTHVFLQSLADPQLALWDAFLRSLECIHQNFREENVFSPLKQLINHTTHIAILYGEHVAWKSPDAWSYLVEVTGMFGSSTSKYFVFHPPAPIEHIKQVETILKVPLPPTYVQFLKCTNGLGLDEYESRFIHGVGESRGPWDDLVASPLKPEYHEIIHYWLQWQDTLAYERRRDGETGIQTFRSDERVCLPFAYTIDDWCFHRSQPDEHGEYPILFWDHELREATFQYPDFAAWFFDIALQGDV